MPTEPPLTRSLRGPVRRLARCDRRLTAAQIAARLGCTASTVRRHLNALAPIPDVRVLKPVDRRLLAQRLHSCDALKGCCSDPDTLTRRMAAANPRLPPLLQTRMLRDPDSVVRANAVLALDRLPLTLLSRLASDPHPYVRSRIADQGDLPRAILARLAGDPDRQVRVRAASNPAVTSKMLTRIALIDLQDPTSSGDWQPAAVAASHAQCPPDVLSRLAQHPSSATRQAVAANPNTPPRVLAALAEDPACAADAVSNPNYPPRQMV